MSMLSPICVVVISKDADIAGVATSIIRGDKVGGNAPTFVAAYTLPSVFEPILALEGNALRVTILAATPYLLLNPKQIDLWLALDNESEMDAVSHVAMNGPSPQNYFQAEYPTAVTNCGFAIPGIPATKSEIDQWLDSLTENLEPWKKRIWNAFRDSS